MDIFYVVWFSATRPRLHHNSTLYIIRGGGGVQLDMIRRAVRTKQFPHDSLLDINYCFIYVSGNTRWSAYGHRRWALYNNDYNIILCEYTRVLYYYHRRIGSFIDAIITIKTIMKENWLVIKNNDRSRSPYALLCYPYYYYNNSAAAALAGAHRGSSPPRCGERNVSVNYQCTNDSYARLEDCRPAERVHFFNPKVNESNITWYTE